MVKVAIVSIVPVLLRAISGGSKSGLGLTRTMFNIKFLLVSFPSCIS